MNQAQCGAGRILIVCINPSQEGFFVPIIYGMLRSFCEQYDELREAYEWVEPVMIPTRLEELDEKYDFSTLDVLGISCYQWNYGYQYKLAELVKQKNPACLVVAGGPQVEWKDPAYFERYPFVDFAMPAEGEAPWRDVLLAKLDGFKYLEGIQGTLVNPAFGEHPYIVAPPLDLTKKPSPWLSLKKFWIRYFKKHAYYHLAACIATTRGCPYRCTYCDWGSKTNLRVRQVPASVVEAEIEFILGALKPWFMFWTDANLGIAKRDVELAQKFADAKKKSGFPLWLYYNNNKNSGDAELAIAKSFREAGLLTKYVLSLQHLDGEVLENIERTNLPEQKLVRLIHELHRIDYPIFTQLIAGCPGDTWEKWLAAFVTLMEMGVHGEYRAYPFGLFPNAPAADADYQQKWGLEIIERPDFVAYFILGRPELNWAISSSHYVVGSSSYMRDEYARMWLLCWMIQAFHDHGIARFIAIALCYGGVCDYDEFYRKLFGWFYGFDSSGEATGYTGMLVFSKPLVEHIEAWLNDKDASFMRYSEGAGGMLEPEEELCMRLLYSLDYFYDELEGFLCAQFDIPRGLVDYQRRLLMRPDFEPARDGIVEMPVCWVDYFTLVEEQPFEILPWPVEVLEAEAELGYAAYEVDISQIKFPVESWFESTSGERRDKAYYDQVVQHNVPGKRRVIFKRLVKL